MVRLRETPLPTLSITDPNYHEVTVYSQAPDPASTIAKVRQLL
ncbi:hypothetical protein [Gordonia sp. 852002-10350_SCH5691597]|nr:hypothetical protein [Gordonia sp. 852002-10350_SCH5691597]